MQLSWKKNIKKQNVISLSYLEFVVQKKFRRAYQKENYDNEAFFFNVTIWKKNYKIIERNFRLVFRVRRAAKSRRVYQKENYDNEGFSLM